MNLSALEALVGSTHLQPWEQLDHSWQRAIATALVANHSPVAMVTPPNSEALAAVMALAQQQSWRVLPCGAGSKLAWGGLGRADLVLCTHHLNQLIEHAVGDLTITVEAGIRFQAVQQTLAQAGQFLPVDPAFPERATVGGLIATGDTGSLRQRYGSVRDMVLGVSFVRADGQMAKAGGRVVKNVAGYDLMKLLTGSYGTLVVLTEVTLRVYPLPEAAQTVIVQGKPDALGQLGRSLARSYLTPTCWDWLSASTATALGLAADAGMAVQCQSLAASVEAQVAHLTEMATALKLAIVTLSAEEGHAFWQRLTTCLTQPDSEKGLVCKIGVKPATALSVLQEITAIAPTGLGQIHAASGLGRLSWQAAPDAATLLRLRHLCQAQAGFLTILQAPVTLKQTLDLWGIPGNALSLMQRLKQQFDPQGILSPGRLITERAASGMP